MKQSEIRKSFVFNKYVIITPSRSARPRDVKEETVLRKNDSCPFCVKNIQTKNVIKKIKLVSLKDEVTALKNIFPAVSLDNNKAYGEQEVIIETKEHNLELADLKLVQIEALLKMYSLRTKEISKNKRIDYILCFKNQGSKAGASLAHSHSQIFATEIVPEDLREEMILAQRHMIKHGTCAYCDIIKKEMGTKRKIYKDKHVVSFAPYASQFHYEAWILSRRHTDNISSLNEKEIKSTAKALKLIASKLKKIGLSYNYFLHNVISDKHQHFYIKVQPRDSVWAGVELGSGLIINSVAPEEAAKYYRKK